MDNQTTDDEIPAETWDRYAQIKLDQQPPGQVKNRTKWLATARANARAEHGETALRWWRTFELTPHRLAECLVDGQAPRNVPRRKDQP